MSPLGTRETSDVQRGRRRRRRRRRSECGAVDGLKGCRCVKVPSGGWARARWMVCQNPCCVIGGRRHRMVHADMSLTPCPKMSLTSFLLPPVVAWYRALPSSFSIIQPFITAQDKLSLLIQPHGYRQIACLMSSWSRSCHVVSTVTRAHSMLKMRA